METDIEKPDYPVEGRIDVSRNPLPPPTESSSDGGIDPDEHPKLAYVRKRAARRAGKQPEGQDDEEASGEESLDNRVAHIKTRTARFAIMESSVSSMEGDPSVSQSRLRRLKRTPQSPRFEDGDVSDESNISSIPDTDIHLPLSIKPPRRYAHKARGIQQDPTSQSLYSEDGYVSVKSLESTSDTERPLPSVSSSGMYASIAAVPKQGQTPHAADGFTEVQIQYHHKVSPTPPANGPLHQNSEHTLSVQRETPTASAPTAPEPTDTPDYYDNQNAYIPNSVVLTNLEHDVAMDTFATSTAPPSRISTGFSIFDNPSDSIDQEELQSQAKLSVFGRQSPSRHSELDLMLSDLGNESARNAVLDYGMSDLWLPFSKQMLRRFCVDARHAKSFLEVQEARLHSGSLYWKLPDSENGIPKLIPQHRSLEDDGDIVVENRLLGEGAVGTVEEVTVSLEQRSIVCVRKRIARPKQLKAQQKIMTAFAREIEIMRQVNHRHCVKFVGSYSDMESVNILSLPVADMDLATYLDRPIGDTEWVVLYKGIDCLCNGL
jgi:hypothetical protein